MSTKEISHLMRVNKISQSIKTVIPHQICKALGVDSNTIIEWSVDAGKDYARVRKVNLPP